MKKNYLFIILSLTMKFLNDKASKLMLQVLLVIVLLHLAVKKYLQSFGSIRMYDLGSLSLGNDKSVPKPTQEESEPETEPETEAEEETDTEDEQEETDYETDYETDGEDELKDYVTQKEQNGEVKGMKYFNEYKNADFNDERLDVASFVKLPKTQGEVTYDLEVPTGQDAERIIADESVMNGGQLMDGIYGFDNMDSQFASL